MGTPASSKPSPPSSVVGVSIGGDRIELSWSPATEAPGTIYRVYWDLGLGYDMYALKTSVREPRYADTGLRPVTGYRYFITSFDGETESSPLGVDVETHSWLHLPLYELTGALTTHRAQSTTPTPPATPSVLSSLPQPAEVILGLMGTNDYLDDLGNLHLVGEVHNDMHHNVGQIRVGVTFYDDAGQALESTTGGALLDLLAPGQRSPFVIVWEDPGDWKRYSIHATARPTTEGPKAGLTVVHSYARLDDKGFYHVVGTVRNDGMTAAYYVEAVISLYDSLGKISNAGFAHAKPSRIAPGTAASFDCVFEYYPYLAEHLVQIAHR